MSLREDVLRLAANCTAVGKNLVVGPSRGRLQRHSPALIADGCHARTDGTVSLGVVGSGIIIALGFDLGDALISLAITLIILRITWGQAAV